MIKCCIFDLDGTLLNTLGTITYYVNKTLAEEGIDPISDDECRRFVGNGPELLIKRALASKNIETAGGVSRILEKYKASYGASPLYLTEPYVGIPELLSELYKRGIVLAVISNKQDEAVVPIVKSFFGEHIATARGARAGVPLKPAPDAVFMLLDELGFKPDEVAYIGDTGVDMSTGRAFGAAKTVGVSWGFRERGELTECGADAVVDTAEELLSEVLG